MNIDPREQARGYDDWRVEDVPEPGMPEDRSEVRQVPEAVAAADVTKRKDTTVETAAMIEAAWPAETGSKPWTCVMNGPIQSPRAVATMA